jgi:hypothetical protein
MAVRYGNQESTKGKRKVIPPKANSEGREARFHARMFELQLRLLPIVLPLAIVTMIVAVVLSVAALSQLDSVKKNSDRIDHATNALAEANAARCSDDAELRRQINRQARTQRAFLISAAIARRNAGKPSDIRAAEAYERLIAATVTVNVPQCGHDRRGK